MSQRNPMNERYTTEAKAGGASRRSASSAKPKSSAAASVVMGTKKKKPAKGKKAPLTKREQKRKERDKQYEAEKRYGDPPTKKFKICKRLWIGFLIASVVTVALSFALSGPAKEESGLVPAWAPTAFLIAAYACIIVTLYLDLGQIRKMRKQYVSQMMASQTKESRAEQKRERRAQREAEKEAERKRLEDEKNREEKKAQAKAARANMSFGGKVKSFFTLNK